MRLHLLLLALIFVLVTSAGVVGFYARVSALIVERNTLYVRDVFARVQANLEQAGLAYGRLLRTIAYNPSVQEYMLETDPLALYGLHTNIVPFLSRVMALTEGVYDIALRPVKGSPWSLNHLGHLIERSGRRYAHGNTPLFSELSSYGSPGDVRRRPVIFAGLTAYSAMLGESYGEPIGDVVMVVGADAIAARLAPFGNTATRFYVLDRAGNVIAGDAGTTVAANLLLQDARGDADTLATVRINGHTYLFQSAPVAMLDGTVVGLTPQTELLGDVYALRSLMLLILLGAVLLMAIPMAAFLRNMSAPLVRLTTFVSRAKSSDPRELRERVEPSGFAEVRTLTEEFNGMLDEIARLTDRLLEAETRAYRAEIVERETELAVLQGQINPHFLYNTLETIRGMALAETPDRVAEVTEALGRMYKYAVRADAVVELADELRMLESYFRIQKMRFGARIREVFHVSTGAGSFRVPRMVLQPIVENAVTHGLESAQNGGTIRVEASLVPGGLEVTVRDDGVGMSDARLAEVRAGLETSSPFRRAGSGQPVGLRNVHDRLALLYGEQASMSIDRVNGETVVRLTFPENRRDDVPGSDRGRRSMGH